MNADQLKEKIQRPGITLTPEVITSAQVE